MTNGIPLTSCWFMFRWGGICCGDHARGYHSYCSSDGIITDVLDAPISKEQTC